MATATKPMLPHYVKSKDRTSISNGTTTLLGKHDERTLYARRVREVIEDYVEDHGPYNLSAGQRALIRRISFMEVELNKLEVRFATDPSVGHRTLDLYSRIAGNQGRLLERLGIEKKNIERPGMNAFLEARARVAGDENLCAEPPAEGPAPDSAHGNISDDQEPWDESADTLNLGAGESE